MGNSHSAEVPRRGQRTTQKLTKPKTGNPTAAGLLSPSGISIPMRSSPRERRLSLPHPPSSTLLANLPETETETDHEPATDRSADKREGRSGNRLSRMLSRSKSSKEVPTYHQRSGSIGIPGSQQGHWSSRANSFRAESEEVVNYSRAPQGTFSINGSRTSFIHDVGSYEVQRLSDLIEAPPHRRDSATQGDRMLASEANPNSRRSSVTDANSPITRTNSEISLYAPMRRKSLIATPGVATREARPEKVSSRGRKRHSLPSTPSRRESIEAMGIGIINFPPQLIDPGSIRRVHTPCEAEYKQTGAFKLGTLRITNGSPTRSPARGPNGIAHHEGTEETSVKGPIGDYFGPVQQTVSGSTKAGSLGTTEKVASQNTAEYLRPPSQYLGPNTAVLSPVSRPDDQQPGWTMLNDTGLEVPQVQVTSKHTAVEDELFDDDQNEYSSAEVLDVRVDTNAKPLPLQSRLTSERRNSKDVSRPDSGIASPASEYSHAPLSKADSGYSSSISLRSFSSKPPVPEKDRSSDGEVEMMPDAITLSGMGNRGLDVTNSPVSIGSISIVEPTNRSLPLPVPLKDPHHLALASPTASGELSPSQHSPGLQGTGSNGQIPQRILSPSSNFRSQTNKRFESHRTSLPKSTLSISTGARKPGRLQRLLSGGRTSLVAHYTHPTEHSTVPAVPRDMHDKLQSHSRMLPMSLRRLDLKSAASKETLGTILSVGSAEMLQDDDIASNDLGSQSRGIDGKPIPISIESAIADTVSPTFAKKPIPRKPVPVRRGDSGVGDLDTPQRISEENSREDGFQAAPWHNPIEAVGDSARFAEPDEKTTRAVPAVQPTRSNSTPSYVEGNAELAYTNNGHEFYLSQAQSMSSSFLELPPVNYPVRSSKSPPVSMRTRNMGPLRAPPPPRSRSTPPENMQWTARPTFSRRGSRDSNSTIPENGGPFTPDYPAVSRRFSRESLQNFPPAQAYRYSHMQPASAPVSFQPVGPRWQAGPGPQMGWDAQLNHAPSLPRGPSSETYSRRNSLASQSSQRSSGTTASSFSRQQYRSRPNLPPLQRSSSYEDYNLVPQDSSSVRDNGPYPSISRNGQSVVSDPWSGRPMSMSQQWDQPWDRPAWHPSQPPRHHYRNRSLDQYGNPAPYRVLHSYHSPAYKNVPIWG
ncbi:hypothetical protein GGR52DRAFT_410604 [Hypoxylon sp. FL1284]|nr:hypothetical protein GGR52DRAFT_410604 [Hypoxylon sp. FL1284]